MSKQTKQEIKSFDDFSLAFDYCHEANKPVIVMVNNKKWKLYPSGTAKNLERNKVEWKND